VARRADHSSRHLPLPEPAPARGVVIITGRFVAGGRPARGIIDYRGSGGCQSSRRPFTAALDSRPNRPQPGRPVTCQRVIVSALDSLDVHDDAYYARQTDTGCTAARQTARRWHHNAACGVLNAGQACRVPGATCTAVRGVPGYPQALASCTVDAHPSGNVALLHLTPCLKGPSSKVLYSDAMILAWAVNTTCQTVQAFPLHAMLGDLDTVEGPCGAIFALNREVTCKPTAGWCCRAPSDAAADLRCWLIADRFRAVWLEVEN
jgi:hypothetical protein